MPWKDPQKRSDFDKRRKAKRLAEGKCARCGKPRENLSFKECDACRKKYRKPLKPVDGRRRKVWAACAHCGQKIPKYKKYCSLECRTEHKTIVKTCPICNKEFRVSKSTAHHYANCSLECKRTQSTRVTCKRCGAVFLNNNDHPRHYCSEECRRPPHIIECAWCGKRVRKTPSKVASSELHFCGFACYRKYSGNGNESGLEKRVRLALEHAGIAYEKEYAVGKYVFDFYLPAAHLLLEADGDYWHSQPDVQLRDQRKAAKARKMGFAVERLPESTVMNDSSNVWIEALIRQYPDLRLTGGFVPLQPMLLLEYTT